MLPDEWSASLRILGLPTDVQRAEIQRTYRHLARLYHPDVNRSASAVRRFREAAEAYRTLGELLSMKEAAEGGDIFDAVRDDPAFNKISTARLKRRLRGSALWQVRASAAAALSGRGEDRVKDSLSGALRDPDSRVRSVVKRAVARLVAGRDLDRIFSKGAPIVPLTESWGAAVKTIQKIWLDRARERRGEYVSVDAAS